MEHLRTAVACLVSTVAIMGLIAILLISSYTIHPLYRSDLCSDIVQSDCRLHLPRADADKIPTLAPPRLHTPSTAEDTLHMPPVGQTVYVHVKTDRADIEVGWASGELIGR